MIKAIISFNCLEDLVAVMAHVIFLLDRANKGHFSRVTETVQSKVVTQLCTNDHSVPTGYNFMIIIFVCYFSLKIISVNNNIWLCFIFFMILTKVNLFMKPKLFLA